MAALIWIGTGLAGLGLLGLVWCIVQAFRARRAGLDDAGLRDRLRTLVAWNMGTMLLSVLGLAMITVGILLG